jgi:hypothetical protein
MARAAVYIYVVFTEMVAVGLITAGSVCPPQTWPRIEAWFSATGIAVVRDNQQGEKHPWRADHGGNHPEPEHVPGTRFVASTMSNSLAGGAIHAVPDSLEHVGDAASDSNIRDLIAFSTVEAGARLLDGNLVTR